MVLPMKTYFNSLYGKEYKLSRRLKTVIGYWTEYFQNRYEHTAMFSIFGEKVTVIDCDNTHYTIYYKWLKFDVDYVDIFETLDLIEQMLRRLRSDVEES